MKKRKRSCQVNNRDKDLLLSIERIKLSHPLWGYRRVWAYLKYREGLPCARNRVYRVMQENGLLCPKNKRLRATRTPLPSKPKAHFRNHIWGTDMTKVKTSMGWVYIHIVLDWYTKKIVGRHISWASKTSDWLEALHAAINNQFPEGYRSADGVLQLVSDNGCQPTSVAYMKACSEMSVRQIFTSFNNPKGNADTERVIRTLKEEMIWPNDWDNAFEAKVMLERIIDFYNNDTPHSAIGYRTPQEFDEECAQRKCSSNYA